MRQAMWFEVNAEIRFGIKRLAVLQLANCLNYDG